MGAQSGPSNNHIIVAHKYKPQSQTVNAMEHLCSCDAKPLGLDKYVFWESFLQVFCTAITVRKLDIRYQAISKNIWMYPAVIYL